MELTHYFAHYARTFHKRPVPDVVGVVHGKHHATMHGFEAIAHIGQCTAHNHAHGIIEVGAAHFLLKADGYGFFGELIH